jgi:hypothetical protein
MTRTCLSRIWRNAWTRLQITIVSGVFGLIFKIAMTAGFQVSTLDEKVKLRVLLDRYRNRDYKETPLLDNFSEIC